MKADHPAERLRAKVAARRDRSPAATACPRPQPTTRSHQCHTPVHVGSLTAGRSRSPPKRATASSKWME
eukprot:1277724-Prymnesium_polylepis.1